MTSIHFVCKCPKKLSKFVIKRNGHCLYSGNKIQGLISKRDFYCAHNCLYLISLPKVRGKNFKIAVWNLYYQTIE